MPELKWNETDVIECLGVLPETDEFFSSHSFLLNKDGLFINITIWQIESLVALSIAKDSKAVPFLDIHFVVRDRIDFINEKDYSSLIFRDCIVVSDQFWMYYKSDKNDVFDKTAFTWVTDLELTVYPGFHFKSLESERAE